MPEFLHPESGSQKNREETKEELPDLLNDYLTGREIPFTNRDNIRQKALKFLVEEKGYIREDLLVDQKIRFKLDGQDVLSLVDIAIRPYAKTLMVWKCASGSIVSRERQILAAARLLEPSVVPLAAVTNGKDVELLNAYNGKVISSGFPEIPSRMALLSMAGDFPEKIAAEGKVAIEQRILFTYDSISCPDGCTPDK